MNQLGQAAARPPPPNGATPPSQPPYQQQQQQQQQQSQPQQQQYPGVRPVSTPGLTPGARPLPPGGAVRPLNQQQFRPGSPLQSQQAGAVPAAQPQSPPRPPSVGGTSFPHNAGAPFGQHAPYQQQQPQQSPYQQHQPPQQPGYQAQQPTPPPPAIDQHAVAGPGQHGLNNRMSHMSLAGDDAPLDLQQQQQSYQQTPSTGPPPMQSEVCLGLSHYHTINHHEGMLSSNFGDKTTNHVQQHDSR